MLFNGISVLFSKNMFSFHQQKLKGTMSKKESKFSVINFIGPG